LRGIGSALDELNDTGLPMLKANLNITDATSAPSKAKNGPVELSDTSIRKLRDAILIGIS
jgi:hypothetical protein